METVSFFTFLEEKITEILFQLFFLALVAFLLIFYGVDMLFVVLLVILFISIQGLFQWCLYRKKRNASQHIIDLVDGLEETYYIADVLPKPKEFQNEAYYYALKKACKSMNDEIGKITEEKQDYQEYVESFVHEIKIPIGALSLTFDNTKNYTLKKETDKIFQLVEQMLYYARSENTEKDYFVKQLQLDEVIHNVILKFRHSLMERKVIINIHDIENVVYTDEKWLTCYHIRNQCRKLTDFRTGWLAQRTSQDTCNNFFFVDIQSTGNFQKVFHTEQLLYYRIGRRFARDNTDFATRAIHKRCDNMLCSRANHLR